MISLRDERPIMVSIRCLTYNHAPYIRRCLDGFVMQKTNFRFQAIVHDDASTDGTTEILREYAEKFPDIIIPMYEKENRWSKHDGTLLTIMYPLLTGKYLAHCEGDDFWSDPYKLQKQVDFMEKNPEFVLIYSDYDIVDQDSKSIKSRKPVFYEGNVGRQIVEYGNFICTPTSLYRRCYDDMWPEFLIGLPFKPKVSDKVHWLFLSQYGMFKFLNDKTASYRRLPKSSSHYLSFHEQKNFIASSWVVDNYFNNSLGFNLSPSKMEKSYHMAYLRSAMKFTKMDFIKELKTGLVHYPSLLLLPKLWVMSFLKIICGVKR